VLNVPFETIEGPYSFNKSSCVATVFLKYFYCVANYSRSGGGYTQIYSFDCQKCFCLSVPTDSCKQNREKMYSTKMSVQD
jgi:hypothetical protein